MLRAIYIALRTYSERKEKQDAALPMNIPASLQDEEELIGYDPEALPSFSPIQDDVLSPEALTPIPEEQTSDQSPFAHELPAFSAEDGPSVGAKRSQSFSSVARTPSPPPTPDLAELDTAYHPPPMLTNMLRQQGSRRAQELSVAAELMMLLWTARAAMLASQPTGLKRPALGAGVLELAAPPRETTSTRKGRPVPGMRVLVSAAPSTGLERPTRVVCPQGYITSSEHT